MLSLNKKAKLISHVNVAKNPLLAIFFRVGVNSICLDTTIFHISQNNKNIPSYYRENGENFDIEQMKYRRCVW